MALNLFSSYHKNIFMLWKLHESLIKLVNNKLYAVKFYKH